MATTTPAPAAAPHPAAHEFAGARIRRRRVRRNARQDAHLRWRRRRGVRDLRRPGVRDRHPPPLGAAFGAGARRAARPHPGDPHQPRPRRRQRDERVPRAGTRNPRRPHRLHRRCGDRGGNDRAGCERRARRCATAREGESGTEQLHGLIESGRANNRQGFPVGAAYLRSASNSIRANALPPLAALDGTAQRLRQFRATPPRPRGSSSAFFSCSRSHC